MPSKQECFQSRLSQLHVSDRPVYLLGEYPSPNPDVVRFILTMKSGTILTMADPSALGLTFNLVKDVFLAEGAKFVDPRVFFAVAISGQALPAGFRGILCHDLRDPAIKAAQELMMTFGEETSKDQVDQCLANLNELWVRQLQRIEAAHVPFRQARTAIMQTLKDIAAAPTTVVKRRLSHTLRVAWDLIAAAVITNVAQRELLAHDGPLFIIADSENIDVIEKAIAGLASF